MEPHTNGCAEMCKNSIHVISLKVQKTVGEEFDENITRARKHVEELCIKKAKLEAMNLLNHPYDQLTSLLNMFPF